MGLLLPSDDVATLRALGELVPNRSVGELIVVDIDVVAIGVR